MAFGQLNRWLEEPQLMPSFQKRPSSDHDDQGRRTQRIHRKHLQRSIFLFSLSETAMHRLGHGELVVQDGKTRKPRYYCRNIFKAEVCFSLNSIE